jgi:signal transduction histidine kinase
LGGIFSYKSVKLLFYKQLDEDLITERTIIEEEISHNQNLPDFSTRFGHNIEVVIYNHKVKNDFFLRDTLINDSTTKEKLNFRHLYSGGNTNRHGFTISILHPLTETDKLITDILKIIIVILIPLWLLIVVLNYLLSKKLWKPFYKTIAQISRYDIKEKETFAFSKNDVYEFTRLDDVLRMMSEKIRNDYFNLKEFTEDASHEIQTPLAIIKSKLEMLIQSENLTSSQLELVDSMNKAVNRISKLNSGLLLLAKIENNQFAAGSAISFNVYTTQSLVIFKDFIEQRNLKITIEQHDDFVVIMNSSLAEILINNLINNAIKYNYEGGNINISIHSFDFSISNSGNPLTLKNPFELFERFNKENKHSESPGLGLAIVKKICDTNLLDVEYKNNGNQHIIQIRKRE